MTIQVRRKTIRKRRRALEPIPYEIPEGICDLQGLLTCMVQTELREYEKRKKEAAGGLFAWLSEEEIAEQGEEGRIAFGSYSAGEAGRQDRHEQKVSEEEAIRTMLQGFADGLFRVLIDDREVRDLAEPLTLTEQTVVTIIRLTFLAGRMW